MGFYPKKSLGQNFLKHPIPEALFSPDELKSDRFITVIEIGPGLGILTLPTIKTLLKLKNKKELILIEIDPRLIPKLKQLTQKYHWIHLINQGVLTVSLPSLLKHPTDLYIYGSLPYNISKRIIQWSLRQISALNQQGSILKRLRFIIQKEVAERYLASPNKTDWLYWSISPYVVNISILKHIPPGAFSPKPQVYSSVIDIIPKQNITFKQQKEAEERLKIIRKFYNFQRKTIGKIFKTLCNLKNPSLPKQLLNKRPSELAKGQWDLIISLYHKLCQPT